MGRHRKSMQRCRAEYNGKWPVHMAHCLHEDVAILQYLLRAAACSRRSKGRTKAGMREQNNTSILFRTTLIEEILKLILYTNFMHY